MEIVHVLDNPMSLHNDKSEIFGDLFLHAETLPIPGTKIESAETIPRTALIKPINYYSEAKIHTAH